MDKKPQRIKTPRRRSSRRKPCGAGKAQHEAGLAEANFSQGIKDREADRRSSRRLAHNGNAWIREYATLADGSAQIAAEPGLRDQTPVTTQQRRCQRPLGEHQIRAISASADYHYAVGASTTATTSNRSIRQWPALSACSRAVHRLRSRRLSYVFPQVPAFDVKNQRWRCCLCGHYFASCPSSRIILLDPRLAWR
jgi:hypothetical protein